MLSPQSIPTIIYLCLFPLSIFAQQYTYNYVHYTVDDGLPTNSLYGVIQDSKGYLWVFTERGISKFDGYEFQNFTVKDSLPTNDIWHMEEDEHGRIWCYGFSDKLVYIKDDRIRQVKLDFSHPFRLFYQNSINTDSCFVYLESTSDEYPDHIGVVVGDSLYEMKIDAYKKYDQYLKDSIDVVGRGDEYSYGDYNEVVPMGIDGFMEVSKTYIKELNWDATLRDSHVLENPMNVVRTNNNSFLYKERKLYYFSEYGAWYWYWNERDCQEYRRDCGTTKIHHWLGDISIHYSGRYHYREFDKALKNEKDFFYDPLLSEANEVGWTIKDRENNLWITTRDNGLFLLTAQARNARQLADSPVRDKVMTLGGNDKTVYWGTYGGKIYQFILDSVYTLRLPSAATHRITDIKITEHNTLFVGNDGTTYIQRGNGFENIPDADIVTSTSGLEDTTLLKYTSSVKDMFWSQNQRRLYISTSAATSYFEFCGPDYADVKVLWEGRANAVASPGIEEIYIGLDNGLWKWDWRGFLIMAGEHELLSEKVMALDADGQGIVWGGTDGYGIYGLMPGGEVITISGTEDDIVTDIATEQDTIWAATNKGFVKILFDSNAKQARLIRRFTIKDGLASNEVNAIFVNKDYIFAGTNNGVTIFDKNEQFTDESCPILHLKEMRNNGTPSDYTQGEMVFRYNENDIEFDFTAISFKNFGRIIYYYKLENADEEANGRSLCTIC